MPFVGDLRQSIKEHGPHLDASTNDSNKFGVYRADIVADLGDENPLNLVPDAACIWQTLLGWTRDASTISHFVSVCEKALILSWG